VTRDEDAEWVIPTEDEWYKAAYYDGDGAAYYGYPTGSDTAPSYIPDGGSITNPDPGNYATYDGDGGADGIGSPYYRTEVGEHENSSSPYGTYDQGGNVWEWNEAIIEHSNDRGYRGGSFTVGEWGLESWYRTWLNPTSSNHELGFRVAEIPEPTPPIMPGDCDEDGDVDFDDFSTLAFNFGEAGGWADGDFDGDGVVDFDDYSRLAFNFGRGTSTGAAGSPVGAPEPATAVLLALGGLALLSRKPKR
jgi:hypothetical protein